MELRAVTLLTPVMTRLIINTLHRMQGSASRATGASSSAPWFPGPLRLLFVQLSGPPRLNAVRFQIAGWAVFHGKCSSFRPLKRRVEARIGDWHFFAQLIDQNQTEQYR